METKQKRERPVYYRMLSEKRNQSVTNLGSKIKYVSGVKSHFAAEVINTNIKCDCLGHSKSEPATVYISTDNEKIKFGLMLCEACLERFKHTLKSIDYVYPFGNEIRTTKTIFKGSEHCLLCTHSKGSNYRVHIGHTEFSCCGEHRHELNRLLENQLHTIYGEKENERAFPRGTQRKSKGKLYQKR